MTDTRTNLVRSAQVAGTTVDARRLAGRGRPAARTGLYVEHVARNVARQKEEGTVTGRIACGHCHGRHGSVSEVRACSTGRPAPAAAPVVEAPAPARSLGTFAGNANEAALKAELRVLEVDAAPGRYAIDGDAETPVRFYSIEVPSEGRWAGFVFVKQVTGHVGEEGVRVKSPRARVEVLAAIAAAGPLEAAQRYGREIGRCSRCNRLLTNAESREYGIGPECRAK